MKLLLSGALLLLSVPVASAQESSSPGQGAPNVFPGPDFALRDKNLKPQKSGMVLGPPQSDGKGGPHNQFSSVIRACWVPQASPSSFWE
jgi:hypothetical protein